MDSVDEGKPRTWVRYRPSLCEGCQAACCRLPVEATFEDLVRLGLVTPDEPVKRAGRRLEREGYVTVARARTGLFTLRQTPGGDCLFLGGDRRCTVYEQRPDVCRRFPTEVGPRVGYCPSARQHASSKAQL